jgi:hypothetical protein
MLFPGYCPAVFDDIPITAIITMETVGTGTRYVFTALHRNEADLEKNKATGFYEGTEIAVDQFVEHVIAMKERPASAASVAAPEAPPNVLATDSDRRYR